MTIEELDRYYAILTKTYEVIVQGMMAFFFYRFCGIYTNERRFIGLITFIYFLTILAMNLFQPNLDNFWIYMIASTVAFLMMWPLLRISVQIKAFISVTYFAVRWLGASIVSILFLPINHLLMRLFEQVIDLSSGHIGLYYFYYNLSMMVVMLLLYWLVLWLLTMVYMKMNRWYRSNLSTKEIIILLIPALSGISSYALWNQFNKLSTVSPLFTNMQLLSYWAIHNIITLAAMLIVLVLFQRLELQHEDKRKQFVLESQIKNIEQHILGVEGTYRELRSLKHDLRNHITIIERLLEQQQYSETEYYLTSMQKALAHAEVSVSYPTGNPITDILIHEKSEQANQFHIAFHSSFYYPASDRINAFDMSVILHNALENAIEATKTIENAWIEVSSRQHKNSYLLTIRNPFVSSLEWGENNLPITTKREQMNHGIGLNNIREIARKYYGDIEIEVDSSIFQINILLISPEPAKAE